MYRFNLLILAFIVCLTATAQEKEFDIVYLKNKEVFYGKIIKNNLGLVDLMITHGADSSKILQFEHYNIMKIEQGVSVLKNSLETSKNSQYLAPKRSFTQDQLGSLRVSNIERPENLPNLTIAPDYKENNSMSPKAYEPSLGIAKTGVAFERDPLAPVPDKRALREWTREIRGYRGFFELSYNFGLDKVRNNTIDISKSVGFQFNPIFYLGVGAVYKLSTNRESSLPIFINPRLNMTDNEDINPFWDVKVGYSFVEARGTYVSTTFGSSFVIGGRGQFALNLGLTYSYLNGNFRKSTFEAPKLKMKEDYHQIGLTLGFEY